MALLNARNNLYRFTFPKGFIHADIEKRWLPYLDAMMLPYRTVHDYLNHTIQTVTFPTFNAQNVEQVNRHQPLEWRGGWPLERMITRDFEVTFKLAEGHINFYIMLDVFSHFLSYQNRKSFMGPVWIEMMNTSGDMFTSLMLNQLTMIALNGSPELSQAMVGPEMRTFSAAFRYNIIEQQEPSV